MKRSILAILAAGMFFAARPDTFRTMTDGTTPALLAPGATAGSYPLSGFESVNLFNGNLSVGIPLLRVGGRGEVGYDVTLRNDNSWRFEAVSFYLGNGQSRSGSTCSSAAGCGPFLEFVPIPAWWAPYEVGYSPGLLFARIGKDGSRAPTCPDNPLRQLVRLTFIDASGAEHELRDTTIAGDGTDSGKPDNPVESQSPPPCLPISVKNRGKVFKSFDGSAMTFLSDFDITDEGTTGDAPTPPVPNGNEYSLVDYPTGYLMLKDGTRYRITQSRVDWIRDRNGNTNHFAYDSLSRVTEIRDAMNRKINIVYGAQSDVLSFSGYNGALRSITVNYGQLSGGAGCSPNPAVVDTTQTPLLKRPFDLFPHPNTIDTPNCFSRRVIQGVTLPNNQTYAFTYNEYAEVTKIKLPTGGAYSYTRGRRVEGGGVPIIQQYVTGRKSLDSGGAVLAKQSYSGFDTASLLGNDSVITTTTTVTNYAADETTVLSLQKHHFHRNVRYSDQTAVSYAGFKHGKEYKTEFYDAGGATLLRTVEHTFANRTTPAWWTSGFSGMSYEPTNDPRITQTETTLAGSPVRAVKQTFAYDPYNNPTEVKELGFDNTELRKTTTNYLTTNPDNGSLNYAALDANLANVVHIRNLPTTRSVYSGSCQMGRTNFEYDFSAVAPLGSTVITGRLNVADVALFPTDPFTTSVKTRGNLTKTIRFVRYDTADPCIPANADPAGAANLVNRTEYDILGNAVRTYDGNGNQTTLDFTDNWLTGSPTTELAGGYKTYALVKSVTNALSQTTTMENDYYLSKARKITDPNSQVTTLTFSDFLDRPTLVSRPDGGSTSFAYDDPNGKVSSTTAPYEKTEQVYDGLGRICDSRAYVTASTFIRSVTKYDGLNRVSAVYNPYEGTAAPSRCEAAAAGTKFTQSIYDGVDRVTAVAHADGRVTTSVYGGNEATVTDPGGVARRSVTDALGRLAEVVENPAGGAGALSTTYAYNVLDSLTGVAQGGRDRTFRYDSAGRLRQAVNPEVTVNYGYDNASNLISRIDPRVSAAFTPDALNRTLSRNYGTGLLVNYCYDNGATCGGTAVGNGMGGLIRVTATKVGVAVSTTRYGGFDAMGRVKSSKQTTNSTDYDFSNYSYDLAGALTSITYPSTRVVATTYDAAGRPSAVTSGGAARASSVQYWPHGAMKQMTLGNGLIEQAAYNDRLQMRSVQVGVTGAAASAWKAEYCWDVLEAGCAANAPNNNNGNLQAQTITAPGFAVTQKYTYDALSRILKAQESTWNQDFVYDRWGNRALKSTSNYVDQVCTPVTTDTTVPFNAANRWSFGGVAYDTSGNFQAGCGKSFLYDCGYRKLRNQQYGFNDAVQLGLATVKLVQPQARSGDLWNQCIRESTGAVAQTQGPGGWDANENGES